MKGIVVLRKRFHSTSLTTPQAATPMCSVVVAGPKHPVEPARDHSFPIARFVLASPRTRLTGIRPCFAGDALAAGVTNAPLRADRGIALPADAGDTGPNQSHETLGRSPASQPCRATGVSQTSTITQARGPEGVTSCLQFNDAASRTDGVRFGSTVDHIEANVPFSCQEAVSQGGDAARTVAYSRDPHPLMLSSQRPTAEADNLKVRPWALATHDTDVVGARMPKVDRSVQRSKPLEEVADDPNVTHFGPALDDAGLATASLDENAPNASGVAISPTPELSSYERGDEIPKPTSETEWGNSSYWLYGGGFLGGPEAHLRTRHLQQDERII